MANRCSGEGPASDLRSVAAVVAGVIDAVVGLLREHADAPHGRGMWYQGGGGKTLVDRLLRLRAELDAIRYLRGSDGDDPDSPPFAD